MADTYRITSTYLYVGGERYDAGDEVELEPAVALAFDDVLEPVGDSDGSEGSETDVEAAAEADFDESDAADESESEGTAYDDLTVSELESELESTDYSDDELEEMLAYEEANKDRASAKSVIRSHLSDE